MSVPSRASSSSPSGEDSPHTVTYCYSVQAAADPGVLPRVLALFAKRGLVPSKLVSVTAPGGGLEIDVQLAGLPADTAHYIAECLRQLVCVRVVLVAMRPA